MTENLKRCPFCGGKSGIQSAFGQHTVMCLSCGVVSEARGEKEKAQKGTVLSEKNVRFTQN